MTRKIHRPFMGLTWPQLHAVHSVRVSPFIIYANARALWALTKKSVPLIRCDEYLFRLTPAGEKVHEAMGEWRPDLYGRAIAAQDEKEAL